ncbi:MAG: hypothetical protein KGH98_01705 [Candidatus Micrarchaeota archaeon]|nr:hypothetical protein [Candidatus Micrarchaeota archaeon]
MAFVETQGSRHSRGVLFSISIIIIAFIAVLALLAYTNVIKINTSALTHNQTAKQRLITDISLANLSQSLQIGYVASGAALSQSQMALQGEINLTEYVLNNATYKNSKLLVDLGSAGALAVYTTNGTTISCTEPIGSYSSGLSCYAQNGNGGLFLTNFNPNTTAILNNSKITYNGTRTFAGDSCDSFLMAVSQKNLSALPSPSGLPPSANSTVFISECISTTSGIPDQLSIYTSAYSKLLAKNTSTYYLNITAESISHPHLQYSDFKPPINLEVDYVFCYPTNITITFTPLVSISNTTFRVLNLTGTSASSGIPGTKAYLTQKAKITAEKYFYDAQPGWLPYNGILKPGQTYRGTVNLSGVVALSTAYSYNVQNPTVCISGSCYPETCDVSGYYGSTTTISPTTITNNSGPGSSGNIVYPVSLNFTPGTWSGVLVYSDANETDANQTFIPDGRYGTMTIYDANQTKVQQASWQWNFPEAINGTFTIRWKASVAQCPGYPDSTNATMFVNGRTPSPYGGYSSTAGIGMPDVHLNSTVTSLGPMNSTFTGNYSSIYLDAGTLFDYKSTACPLNVSVDGVWATKG